MTEAKRAAAVSAEEVRTRLAGIKQKGPAHLAAPPSPSPPDEPPLTDFRRRCRARVVLLDYFDLASLGTVPAGPAQHPTPLRRRTLSDAFWSVLGRVPDRNPSGDRIAPRLDPAQSRTLDAFASCDCDLVATGRGTGWRLRLTVRHETLRELGAAGVRDELARPDAIPAGDDDVTHRMARRLLAGHRELNGLSATELSGMLRAGEWLAPLGLELPAGPAVRAALDLANVLAPLRAVAGPHFVGRERELALLQDYLYEEAPGDERPLAIHGPGGVGKSTLLARFVLDHVDQGAHDRRAHPLLFSYLSFDRAELDPQFPLTLLGEVARQISLQAPELVGPLDHVRQQIDELLTHQVRLRNEAATMRGTSTRDVVRHGSDVAIVAANFAEVVRSVTGNTPLLLVLDTFEMAQRRSRSFLGQLDEALRRMRGRLPLRVVVAGRAPVEELTVRNVALQGLDKAQSEALLTKAFRGRNVDQELVRLIVEQVSGNPLSLRLAADLVLREGTRAVTQGRARRRLLHHLRAEQVQGVLYRRILDHVDKQVRPLANPGLIVRQITPDVIQQVLAEPCGLGHVTPARAQMLFELLRREVALVTEARPGVLVHRADVRREMLPLLEAENPDRVRDIHERAIAYYEKRTGIDDQIEHLYHRLMLGQPSETLDAQWHDAAAMFLEDAWDELPPEARVYLAGRLGVEADPADLAAADRTAWVRQATSQARALLDAGQPKHALEILGGGQHVPRDLAVTRLVVEALAAQDQDSKALVEARAAIAEADERNSPFEFLQLNLLAGRIAEDRASVTGDPADFAEAAQFYLEARQSAVDLDAKAEALTAGAGILRVARRAARPLGALQVGELRHQLVADVATLTDRVKATHPGLLRELAAELGDELPGLLVDAARHIGVETGGASARQLPAESQERLRRAGLPSAELPADRAGTSPPQPWTLPHEDLAVTSSEVGQSVADALATSPGDDGLKESLMGYWQSEADRPSFDYDAEGGADRG